MDITPERYEHIGGLLPRQRGNVNLDNLAVLNAILYVMEHGCKWRGLPERFGNWHNIYTFARRCFQFWACWKKIGSFLKTTSIDVCST